MKKTKVENVSSFKLDFFLIQNKQDVRVVLEPGETSWCDNESQTKSMILYERKNLIKSTVQDISTIIDEALANADNDEALDKLHTTEDIEYVEIVSVDPTELTIGAIEESLTPLEKAKKETEEYKKESEKTYKGKKRGRKKKRGPKPGSKRKKSGDSASPESPAE
jgi:hypothetical protein